MLKRTITRMLVEESGQDLIEYSLLAAFISLVCVGLIQPIGSQINSWYVGYDAVIDTIPGGGS